MVARGSSQVGAGAPCGQPHAQRQVCGCGRGSDRLCVCVVWHTCGAARGRGAGMVGGRLVVCERVLGLCVGLVLGV